MYRSKFYYVLSILHNEFIKYHSLTHLTDVLSRLWLYKIERDVVVPCTFVDCAKNTICVFMYKSTEQPFYLRFKVAVLFLLRWAGLYVSL